MKKVFHKICATLFVLIFSIICCSCEEGKNENKNSASINEATPLVLTKKDSKYKSYVGSVANGDGSIKTELTWGQSSYFNRKGVQKEKKAIFNKQEYCGIYEESLYGAGDWVATDIYLDGKTTLKFRADNGEFTGFVNDSAVVKRQELLIKNVENSKEQIEKIAKNYASQYADISEYTLDEYFEDVYKTSVDGYEFELKYHIFRYRKYVDGYRTKDYVYIKITNKGVLWSLTVSHLGEFDNIPKDSIDDGQLENAINNKIYDLYSDSESKVLSYSIDNHLLTYSPKGELVIISDVTVCLADEVFSERLIEVRTILGSYESIALKA